MSCSTPPTTSPRATRSIAPACAIASRWCPERRTLRRPISVFDLRGPTALLPLPVSRRRAISKRCAARDGRVRAAGRHHRLDAGGRSAEAHHGHRRAAAGAAAADRRAQHADPHREAVEGRSCKVCAGNEGKREGGKEKTARLHGLASYLLPSSLIPSLLSFLDSLSNMSKIDRIEIHEFTYETPNLGLDSSGFNFVYQPGGKFAMTKFALVVRTADGGRGEYVDAVGRDENSARSSHDAGARSSIGKDASQREYIYDICKRALPTVRPHGLWAHRHRVVGLGRQELKQPIYKMLGGWRTNVCRPTPALSMAIATADSLRRKPTSTSRSSATTWAIARSRCTAGPKATCAKKSRPCSSSATRFRGKMALMLDPACELRTFADALAVGRACDEAGFLWYEDPFRDSGVSAFSASQAAPVHQDPAAADRARARPRAQGRLHRRRRHRLRARRSGLRLRHHRHDEDRPSRRSASAWMWRSMRPGPAHRHCMAAIRNTNFYELALVGPKCDNALPPVYADGYTEQLKGSRPGRLLPGAARPRLRRDLRLGIHRETSDGAARVQVSSCDYCLRTKPTLKTQRSAENAEKTKSRPSCDTGAGSKEMCRAP